MNVIGVQRLLIEALGREQSCFAILSFRPSASEVDDWMLLFDSVRWLHRPECDSQRLVSDLRKFGLGLVLCSDEEEARRLFEESGCRRLWLEVYAADGRRLASGKPQRKVGTRIRNLKVEE
jgi:hypothetical protein